MERDSNIKMTAGFYARGINTIFSNPKTTHEERERYIEEVRRLAQFAADHDAVNLVKTKDLSEGQQ